MQNVRTPIDIESFRHILNRIIVRKFRTLEELYICILAVHSLGLPDVQHLLVMSDNAINEIVNAVLNNCTVVCDTRMLACGVRHSLIKRNFSNNVVCLSELRDKHGVKYIADVVPLYASLISESILLVGSSPQVIEKVLQLNIRPRAIIATPPGFLKSPEVKSRLVNSGLCYITVLGSVGSASLCLGIFNAVLDVARGTHLKILQNLDMVST